MHHFGNVSEISRKQDQSNIVTEADLASEQCIIQIIQAKFPTHNILSEERGFIRTGSDLIWVIDPLDGTSNFAARIPWFGVLIAILKGGVPVIGVMYFPDSDTLYFCEEGQGVFCNGKQVNVSSETNLSNILCSYGMDSSTDQEKTRMEVELLFHLVNRVRNVRATNSPIDFCYTIDGRFGASLNQTTKIWDIAPVELMIREAGGIFSDLAGEKLHFDLGAGYERNYAVLGTNKELHPQILDIITHKF